MRLTYVVEVAMNRRALIGGAIGVALLDITSAGAKRRKRRQPQVRAAMTWKGKIPLWNVDGEQVDVTFGWDDLYFKANGRITATITVPNGMTATLVQDETPTDWTVAHWSSPEIKVTATFPCTNTISRQCSTGQSGIKINAMTIASPHGWSPVTVYGSYNVAYSATTT